MQGVAVRDLKLENILLDRADSLRPLLKICDFGFSKVTALWPFPLCCWVTFTVLCGCALQLITFTPCAAAVLPALTRFCLTAA